MESLGLAREGCPGQWEYKADLPAVGTGLQALITNAAQGRGRMEDRRNSGRKKALCSTNVTTVAMFKWDIYFMFTLCSHV